jgi:hypothetical protein
MIEAERKAIDGCGELVVRYDEKIRQVLERVWD